MQGGKMKKVMYYFTLVCLMLLLSVTFVEATTITSLPYEITARGYYTINTNLTSSGHGIIVKANNVTIDLKGYMIEGKGTGSYYGIYMNGRNNVEIRNGTIRNFGSKGIYEGDIDSGNSHRVINVRVIANHSDGICLYGSNHLIEGCTASSNSGYGIVAGASSKVSSNTACDNGYDGIRTGNGSTVSSNIAYNNGRSGIAINDGCTVKNNTSYHNQHYGVELVGAYNLVDGNTAYQNDQAGAYANMNSCGTCVFGDNVAP
jgi:parallel beta-helix repeat protein